MAQSLVLSIDVCRGLVIPPLRIEDLAEPISSRSLPKIGPGFFFFLFLESFEKKTGENRAHSDTYRNLSARIFEKKNFFGNSRASISTGLRAVRAVFFIKHFDANTLIIMEIFTCQNSKKLAKLFFGDYTSCSLANLWKEKFAILFAI